MVTRFVENNYILPIDVNAVARQNVVITTFCNVTIFWVATDHHGTYIVLNISTPIYKSFKRNVWVYKNADYESMKNDISEIDWPSMFDTDDIDTAVMLFGRKVTDLSKEYIPRKTVTVRPSDRPWFNSDIRREIIFLRFP